MLSWMVVALAALNGCAATSDNAEAASEASGQAVSADYDAYAAFAAGHGSAPRSDRALVIGIRGRSASGKVHDARVSRSFDDTLVVLTPDERIVRLAVSTHPWE